MLWCCAFDTKNVDDDYNDVNNEIDDDDLLMSGRKYLMMQMVGYRWIYYMMVGII